MNRYLIVGTGGVGASIAAFLHLGGKAVECIARGEHLEKIREEGLQMESSLKGDHLIPLKAFSGEAYSGKADVIFVCVKNYSLESVTGIIQKAAHPGSVVIPILNVYGVGPRLQTALPDITVLDGCIYIVGYLTGAGKLSQVGKIFRIVFGAHPGTPIAPKTLEGIRTDLVSSGIKADISADINRDTFIKWSFISAMACTGAYFDVPMGAVQQPGEIRDTFTGLSAESSAIGKKMGIEFPEDQVAYNLKVIDKLDPASTASMQRDLATRKDSEINGLLFDMLALAEKYNIEAPTYRKVARKFS